MKVNCITCGRPFAIAAPNQTYCSARCREKNYRQRARKRSQINAPQRAILNHVPTEDEEFSMFEQLLTNPLIPPFLVPRPSSTRVTVPPGLIYHEEYNPSKNEFFYTIEWDQQILSRFRSEPEFTMTQLIALHNCEPTHPVPLQDRTATLNVFAKVPEYRHINALDVLNKHLGK